MRNNSVHSSVSSDVSIESTTQTIAAPQSDANSCRHTGLSKPECHCQECMRDLVARFSPPRRD